MWESRASNWKLSCFLKGIRENKWDQRSQHAPRRNLRWKSSRDLKYEGWIEWESNEFQSIEFQKLISLSSLYALPRRDSKLFLTERKDHFLRA